MLVESGIALLRIVFQCVAVRLGVLLILVVRRSGLSKYANDESSFPSSASSSNDSVFGHVLVHSQVQCCAPIERVAFAIRGTDEEWYLRPHLMSNFHDSYHFTQTVMNTLLKDCVSMDMYDCDCSWRHACHEDGWRLEAWRHSQDHVAESRHHRRELSLCTIWRKHSQSTVLQLCDHLAAANEAHVASLRVTHVSCT